MDISFTPGVPNDAAKANLRMKKMQEAAAKLTTEDMGSVDLTEEGMNIADAIRSARTNYGAKKITEDLRTGPADPSKKNLKPMKCTKCQYIGEPAHADGKCKECGAAMVPTMTNTEDFPPKNDNDDAEAVPPPPPVDASGMPQGGGQNAGGAPGGMPMGMSPMPPGEPDDGKDDDFDPSDQPEVGEMVAYAVGRRGRAGRVMLVFRGEATIDTGYRNKKGEAVVDRIAISLLRRVPESLFESASKSAMVPPTRFDVGTTIAIPPKGKSKAQKLIEQVANGRRTADQAVEALLS